MKTPRFTDTHKMPVGGYVSANRTDIRETFKRIKEQLEKGNKDGNGNGSTSNNEGRNYQARYGLL